MQVLNNNIYSPTSNPVQKDLRARETRGVNNKYKEAYRLDINPIYLQDDEVYVPLFNTEILYYVKSLLTFKKL